MQRWHILAQMLAFINELACFLWYVIDECMQQNGLSLVFILFVFFFFFFFLQLKLDCPNEVDWVIIFITGISKLFVTLAI